MTCQRIITTKLKQKQKKNIESIIPMKSPAYKRPTFTIIPTSNQKGMGQDLMDELRGVINDSKYDHMCTARLIGVLEMTKLHYWQCNLNED
jgi:hypothetical protein